LLIVDVEFRRYRLGDDEAIWLLHLSGLDQMGANAGEGPWDDDLRDIDSSYLRGGEFFVAEVDEQLVAMGGLKPVTAGIAELKRLRVAQELQGQGLGENVVYRLIERAQGLGFTVLIADTTSRQEPAQRLLSKFDFHETHRQQGDDFDVIYYRRELGTGDSTR
jgi:GNAT superfamily N-acetyltransferase